jgi:hypothetical protein
LTPVLIDLYNCVNNVVHILTFKFPPFRASSVLTTAGELANKGAERMVAAAVAEVLVMNLLLVSWSAFTG